MASPFLCARYLPAHHRHPREKRGSSIPEAFENDREAAAYWIARSSRAMTAEFDVPASRSPSLPRRDDLDLVAGLQRGLGPAVLRHHVVIHRDRKMRAFEFQLAQQRVDA